MRRTGPRACRLRLGKEFGRLEPDGIFSFDRRLRMLAENGPEGELEGAGVQPRLSGPEVGQMAWRLSSGICLEGGLTEVLSGSVCVLRG